MIEDLFKNVPTTKVFGTAGAGKTTKLIDIINDLFTQGAQPERIVFASFTNKAVDEMVSRVLVKFPKFNEKQFINFKTIHALGYAASTNKKVMQSKDLAELARSLGIEISFKINPEDSGGAKVGDKIITIESLSRLRMVDLKQQHVECNFDDVPYRFVEKWRNALTQFKQERGLVDFTDLLMNYNGKPLDADYMIIDEAQDLCPLQWHILDQMSVNCKRVYIAGDDDQLIYKWAGADVDYILNIKCQEEIVLSKSHRLPSNIYRLSRSILRRIKNRKAKECEPTKADGKILHVGSFEDVEFQNDQEYLILIRNKFHAFAVCERLEYLGLPYVNFNQSSTDCDEIKAIFAWERYRKTRVIDYKDFQKCKAFSLALRKCDRETIPNQLLDKPWYEALNMIEKSMYFRAVLSKGFKLKDEPKIKISTIHQAKGGECENVIVLTDVSFNTWQNINSDDEHRVWYVAVSRAKQNLTIVLGKSDQHYKISD